MKGADLHLLTFFQIREAVPPPKKKEKKKKEKKESCMENSDKRAKKERIQSRVSHGNGQMV